MKVVNDVVLYCGVDYLKHNVFRKMLVQMIAMKQSKMNWMASLHPCWTISMNNQAQPKKRIITP